MAASGILEVELRFFGYFGFWHLDFFFLVALPPDPASNREYHNRRFINCAFSGEVQFRRRTDGASVSLRSVQPAEEFLRPKELSGVSCVCVRLLAIRSLGLYVY